MEFREELKKRTQQAEEILEKYLPEEKGFAMHLAEAMNYSVRSGGKRLRPILLLASYELFGGRERIAEPFAAAMEMIHTHSLIHDDLPALDNDDYRRGRLTTHKVFGEAMGVLSGDALLNYAYETVLRSFSMTEYPDRAAHAAKVLAEKTGIHGMLGGQSVDVENDGKELEKKTLDYIYEHKTAALLEAPLMIGAILAGAGLQEIEQMEQAGKALGLAFQIQDDILDVTSTTKELGKPVHSDEKNHKVTYVSLMGLEHARDQVKYYSDKAREILEPYPEKEFLGELIESLIYRKK